MACFLAQWHRSTFSGPSTTKFVTLLQSCTEGINSPVTPIRLMAVLCVAADTAVYSVFEADSAETVLRVCTRAGALPQRLTPDVDARFIAVLPPASESEDRRRQTQMS